MKLLAGLTLAIGLLFASEAIGQTTTSAHTLAVGKGAGNVGFVGVGPGSAGAVPIGQGSSADPSWHAVTGDCSLGNSGAIVCSKTNGVSFAPSATTDTTNASNISSGTLAVARGGTGIGSLGAGVANWLAMPSSANLAAATTDEVGSGPLAFGGREVLRASRSYYVRSDGSDSNNCLSNTAGGACLTWQHVYNLVATTIDLAGNTVTLQAGTVTTWPAGLTMTIPWIGGNIVLDGAGGTISATTSDAVNATLISPAGTFTVQNIKLQTSVTNGVCIHGNLARITFVVGAGVNFGACTNAQMGVGYAGDITVVSNYTISGGGATHLLADSGGIIVDAGFTVTITGTPAYSGAFATCLTGGLIQSFANTWTGSATGVRYNATLNGVIYTAGSGVTYFPGNSSGTTATGGVYN